ncbi:ribosomal L7Ae/L30e/S12e/Gadd45 family protein [Candidatus Woesearchaeota archaeon]|nr:ribosomal L7Ae/L30e/S12e/Gadd45 family protein [Candidatus Woesearchaeota archaeon]
MSDIIAEIKKLVKEDRLIMGTERTVKALREGTVEKIFLASNCSEDVRESITHYAEISGAEVVDAGLQNDELGDICKRPHPIAVLGLVKQ